MNIKILDEEQLTTSDREQIEGLNLLCFGQEAIDLEPIQYFAPTFKHLLLFDGQKLVSYLRVVLRETWWRGQKILIGGIGSVETDPKFQGKGFASQLLEKAMEVLKNQQADFALLQTNIEKGAKLYGRVGFISADRPYEVLNIHGNKRIVKAKSVMFAPMKNPQLVQEIMNSDEVLFIGKGDW